MKCIVTEAELLPEAVAEANGSHRTCDCRRVEISKADYEAYTHLRFMAAQLNAEAEAIIAKALGERRASS
jgi:hypothetical protein